MEHAQQAHRQRRPREPGPVVATTSESHRAPPERVVADHRTPGSRNIRLATTVPAHPPAT